MRELDNQLATLQALAREGEAETALAAAEGVSQLCARIRRDFVEMAYRQGVIDGMRLRDVLADDPETARTDEPPVAP